MEIFDLMDEISRYSVAFEFFCSQTVSFLRSWVLGVVLPTTVVHLFTASVTSSLQAPLESKVGVILPHPAILTSPVWG
jgi:hypothetical protein